MALLVALRPPPVNRDAPPSNFIDYLPIRARNGAIVSNAGRSAMFEDIAGNRIEIGDINPAPGIRVLFVLHAPAAKTTKTV